MAKVFAASDFGFADVDAGNSLQAVLITSLPAAGSLALNGVSVTASQIVSVADITAGNLRYTPAANANGNAYASFGFKVGDGTAFSNSAYTMSVNVAPMNDAPTGNVTVTGTATQNQTLSASHTLADADGLGAVNYKWQASSDGTAWTDISGATAASFTLTQAQVGKQVRAVAGYTDGFGAVESKVSAATAAIANVNDAPTGSVTVTGTATQNQTLTAANTLADADGLGTITSKWQVSSDGMTWTDISGATAASFTLTQSQVGKQVRALASYTDGFGTAESKTSNASEVVDGFGTIRGSTGNDSLIGGTEANILVGGQGNDILRGAGGNDTYLFNRGDGADEIRDEQIESVPYTYSYRTGSMFKRRTVTAVGWRIEQLDAGNDTLRFGSDIALTDLDFTQSGADIVLGLRRNGIATSDQITLKNQTNNLSRIEFIEFASGERHALADWKIGTAGNDSLSGGAGGGWFTSGKRNDWFHGGKGNDTLSGGAGNDTYLFNRGDGADTLVENDATLGNTDVLQLGSGISYEQLWFARAGNNLDVSLIGTADKVTVKDWYAGAQSHVERIQTADGRALLDSKVDLLVQAMAAFAPPAAGQSTLPDAYQTALAPVLAANWQASA